MEVVTTAPRGLASIKTVECKGQGLLGQRLHLPPRHHHQAPFCLLQTPPRQSSGSGEAVRTVVQG